MRSPFGKTPQNYDMPMKGLTRIIEVMILVVALDSFPAWDAVNANAATSQPSVPMCIQGQLNVAIEGGGGLQTGTPLGYTFLIVNITSHSCELQGFPWWFVIATTGTTTTKVAVLHRPNSLYAQPPARRVILRRQGVATFGLSYRYLRAPTFSDKSSCHASLVDFRLPATHSRLFSYEFPVHIDVCATNRIFDVTPVEGASAPLT